MAIVRDPMPSFELLQAISAEAAQKLLAQYGQDAWILAGGMDSFDWLKDRIKRPKVVVDLGGVEELKGVRERDGGLEIGAMTTLTEVATNRLIRQSYSLLADAAASVASPQIRNQGTLGGNVSQDARCWYYRAGWPCYRAEGNICYADTPVGRNREHAILHAERCVAVNPSDTAPALIALDAKFVIHDHFVVDMTANPDFSQVESEDPQITVNQRFAVYFPEKRPFFLENEDFFRTPLDLMFTRSIGDPSAGIRLTGKEGPYSVGVMATDDRSPGLALPNSDPLYGTRSYFTVARVNRDIFRQSSVGVLYSDWECPTTGEFNRVGGVDTHLKFNSNWTLDGQAVDSSSNLNLSCEANLYPFSSGNHGNGDYYAGPAEKMDLPLVNTFMGADGAKNQDDNWAEALRVWPDIVAFANDHGRKITIENCPMLFSYDEWPGGHNIATSPRMWRRILEQWGGTIGLNFDPSHLILQMIDIPRFIGEFGPHILHVQAKDLLIDREGLYERGVFSMGMGWQIPRIPGLGEVDWSVVHGELYRQGYEGDCIIEHEDRRFEGSDEKVKQGFLIARDVLRPYCH